MMLTKHGRKAGAVIEAILILAGLGLLVKAAIIGTAAYKFENAAQSTEGVVTGVGTHNFGVYVQFNASDTGIIFKQDGFFNNAINDHVPVLYDPANPQKAIIDGVQGIWFNTVALALPGVLFAVFGFGLRKRRNI